MLSIGCIQAQHCHTGNCPTGVATQKKWLVRGLDPTLKSARLANYLITLRKELKSLAAACGHAHPGLVPANQLDIVINSTQTRSAPDVYNYQPGWGLPPASEAIDAPTVQAA
jgi:hypothetical protein